MADRWCPVHSHAGADALNAWPCPDDCPDFHDELVRRIEDVRAGNFFRMVSDDQGTQATADDMLAGRHMWQEYRNGEPYGDPRPHGPRGGVSDG